MTPSDEPKVPATRKAGAGKKGTAAAPKETPRFDVSLGRLEEIVAELEQGGLGLEESLEQYKEGIRLFKGCREQIASFRAQVEELSADGVKPHDRDPDVDADAPY